MKIVGKSVLNKQLTNFTLRLPLVRVAGNEARSMQTGIDNTSLHAKSTPITNIGYQVYQPILLKSGH